MAETIKVYRYRTTPYAVNFPTPTGVQSYQFTGSKKGIEEYKLLPIEVIQWLQLSTMCFKNGELVLDEQEIDKNKGFYVGETELEEYKKNTHTRDDIESILTGNFMKMKSTLNEITSDSEKKFVVDVAREINLDSTAKRKFLAEWIDTKTELLFIDDEE